jgi:hypothetical protein
LDIATRARLAAYLRSVHWRRGCDNLRVAPGTLRRALKGGRIRAASAIAIRSGLALVAEKPEPTP